jgi:hypothetical protein
MPDLVKCYMCNEMMFRTSLREHYAKRHNISMEEQLRLVDSYIEIGKKVTLDIAKRYSPAEVTMALPYLIAASIVSRPGYTDLEVEQFLHEMSGVVRIILGKAGTEEER